MAIRFLFMVLAAVLALGFAVPGGKSTVASAQTSVTAEHVGQAKKKPAKKSKKKTSPQKKTAEPAKPKHPMEMPMTVVIVRSASGFCEPLCPEWIAAEGEITAATPALFRKVLKQIGDRKLPVILGSPGGNVDSAVQIGRMLRKAGLDVMLGFFMYDGCKPSDKTCKLPESQKGIYRGSPYTLEGYCVSACPLILAGGVKRLAPKEAKIGLHQVRTTWSRERVRYEETYRIVRGKKKVVSRKVVGRKTSSWTTDGLNKTLRKKLVPYLKEMGISQDFLVEMEKAPHESVNMLSHDRALALKLLTPEKPAVSVFGFTFDCKPEKPEPYCIARPVAKPPPAPKDEMIVEIVRGTGECEPICPEWVAADGVITSDTPKRFAAVLKEMGDRKLPILLNSTHGNFDAAMEIGRMIRKKGLDTGVAVTGFIDCHPRKLECKQAQPPSLPYKALVYHFGECGRECLIVLAGGVHRHGAVAAGTYFDPPESIPTGHKSKTAAQLTEEYLREMSVSPNLLSLARTGSLSKPIRLSVANMQTLRLSTEHSPFEFMASPKSCSGSVPAYNCVSRLESLIPPAPGKEMIVVRMRAQGSCGEFCPEWILAEGIITKETPRLFRAMLKQDGAANLPIILNSEGGDFDAALSIGRMIREKGFNVFVATGGKVGCSPRDPKCNSKREPSLPYTGFVEVPGDCLRECLFVLAGGIQRYGAWPTRTRFFPPEAFTTRQSGNKAPELIQAFLSDLGLTWTAVTSGLHSGIQSPQEHVDPSACQRFSPPPNCVRRDKAS